jgi:glucose-1-phosphate adenylyltransferase
MNDVTALVLAGGRRNELGALTMRRAKAALPFAGTHRIIDFALSNLARSAVPRVGVLSQYRPSSLMDHVGMGQSWGLIGRGTEVRMLPPFQADSQVDWYNGTADAVLQNRSFYKDSRHVIIISGDHIYQMDYREMLASHIKRGAALTMGVKKFPKDRLSRFGVCTLGPDDRVVGYNEKPAEPASEWGSLTVYIFDRYKLDEYLSRCEVKDQPYQIYGHMIPQMIEKELVVGWKVDDYWSSIRTVDDYFKTSMDIIDPSSGFSPDSWNIHTNPEETGIGGSGPFIAGPEAKISASRISSGCQINGTVTSSILSPKVVIEPGAIVRDSILLQGVVVKTGTVLDKVIADKHCIFKEDCKIGNPDAKTANEAFPDNHSCGVTIFGRDCIIPAGSKVGGNCQIAPEARFKAALDLADGTFTEVAEEDKWNELL